MKEDKISDFIERLDYYEKLVADVKNLEPEEMLLLQSERDDIHDIVIALKESNSWTQRYEQRLRKIDASLQASMSLNLYTRPVNESDKKSLLWWWHLGELDVLTDEEKSTL